MRKYRFRSEMYLSPVRVHFASILGIVCINNPEWYRKLRWESGSFQDNEDMFRNNLGNVWNNQINGKTLSGDGTQRLHVPNLFLFKKIPSCWSDEYMELFCCK